MKRRTPLRSTGPLRPGKPLQRTGLVRRTPMTSRPTPAAPGRRVARRRDTGPDRETTTLLWDRSGGRCEICGRDLVGVAASRHHRQPRGMGGSTLADVNALSNLLLLCGTGTTGCHGRVEANRSDAIARGWLVPRGYDPAHTPVVLSVAVFPFGVTYLTRDGQYEELLT